MAKVQKKLRRLNQRAGSGVMPSVHPMTKIVLTLNAGSPEGSREEPKSQAGLKRHGLGSTPTFADRGGLGKLTPIDIPTEIVGRYRVA